MRVILIITYLIFFVVGVAFTQETASTEKNLFNELMQPEAGKGQVKIIQDPRIAHLVSKHVEINRKAGGIKGYRIQVFFTSGTQAKNQALKVRSDINTHYSEIDCYIVYEAPYFKVRVGDFRTRNEAFKVFKEISKDYPSAFLVEDMIELPSLK